MPRGRDVTTEDMSSDYLEQLTGSQVDKETDDVETEDAVSPDKETRTDDAVDKGARQERPRDDKQQQRTQQDRRVDKQQPNKADNRQQTATKIDLNDARTRDVYHALKERMQPVFLAQDRKINEATKRAEQLETQLNIYKERDNVAQQYKLTPIQQVQGMQLMAAYLKDPAATVKLLIDKAQANGHNIQIGSTPSGVSPEAIKDMIAQAVAPLTSEAEQRAEQNRLRVEAQQALDTFYAEFPDAKVHEGTLNEALRRNPGMSLHRALSTLKDYYYQHGLDWSVPLNVHVERSRAAPEQRRSQPMTLRGGNGAQFEQQDRQAETGNRVAPATARYRDIVRQVMGEYGLDTTNL